jgi:L-aspartate oxidase
MTSVTRSETHFDAIIIGGGIAGLAVAFYLPEQMRVALLFKATFEESSTWVAQGGIAGYIVDADRPEYHIEDTLKAGDGLCHEPAVRILIHEGTERLLEMLAVGVAFDKVGDQFDLALEGGHRYPRILHAGDRTGRAIAQKLREIISARDNVTVFPGTFVTELCVDEKTGACVGVRARAGQEDIVLRAPSTVLATGGAGQVFAHTTNPVSATGDGIALAYRAGALICDMEFYQFHPTVLADESSPRLLITEALRGYGARLVDERGNSIMEGVHPLADLAPRHVIVRRMAELMQHADSRNVYLDARHFSPDAWKNFPFIYSELTRRGYHPERDLIPVSPAAHFMIGGVVTDLFGRTRVPGLYACGEVAATGVHGANRLASNSLLEGLVFGKRIAYCVASTCDARRNIATPVAHDTMRGKARASLAGEEIAVLAARLRTIMWQNVGLVRNETGLAEAIERIEEIQESVSALTCREQRACELANMALTSRLIAEGARARRETRGAHVRSDFPERNDDVFLVHICHSARGTSAMCLWEEVAASGSPQQ